MSTPYQKRQIWKLCKHDETKKSEMVQEITNDKETTAVSALTFDQANLLIQQLGGKAQGYIVFGYFDFDNQKHRYIVSLCHQLGWTTIKGSRSIADLERLGHFVAKRTKAKKPLQKQEPKELSDTITSLEATFKSQK